MYDITVRCMIFDVDKMENAPEQLEINNDVAPKVAIFYTELGLIDEDQLQSMEYQSSGAGDTKARFRHVLNLWWTCTPRQHRTWKCIVEALESKGMKQNRVARAIREKYKC